MSEMSERSASSFPFSMEEFVSPPVCFQPSYSWVWNDKITWEGVTEQLNRMYAAGIKSTYILPESKAFRPNTMRTYLEPDYLTDEYMALARRACEYALSLGMSVWLYDESGWPSGYAGGRVIEKHPELCRKHITKDESGHFVRGESQGYVAVDSLDDDTGRAFVEETHERYAKAFEGLLGNKIPMMFTDEPGAGRAPWPRGVEEKFFSKYGYDMTPFLSALMDEENAQTYEQKRARADYGILLGELFRDHYFGPILEWCRAHGMLSGGHVDLDSETDGCVRHGYGSLLPLLRALDLPGVDVIWRQIYPPKTPSDTPTPEGFRFFPRLASSAAAQTGHRLALSESFAVYGAGLDADTMRYVINYQLARGINLFNFMSSSYSKNSGLPLVARPGFVSEIPGYAHLASVNEYTARASLLMSLGAPGAQTALYFPARDFWAGGETKARAMKAFEEAGDRLERAHIDFDLIDDEGVRLAASEDGRLRLGLASYSRAVIPACAFMPEDVRARLSALEGECVPALACDSPCFRVRVRNLENGDKIAFLFNECADAQTARIRLPEGARACALNPADADATAFEEADEICLPGGGAKILLISQSAISFAKAPAKARFVCAVQNFTLTKTRESRVEPVGLRAYAYTPAPFPAEMGSWAKYFGELFSGEATYAAQVDLGETPDAKKTYAIDLGRVECSARVSIDGAQVGVASMSPMRVRVPGSRIPSDGRFTLEIEVANTLANQCALKPIPDYFPAWEMGEYSKRTVIYEHEAIKGGLYGPVRVFAEE